MERADDTGASFGRPGWVGRRNERSVIKAWCATSSQGEDVALGQVSHTRTGAGIRFVRSWGLTLRDARERHQEDVRDGARVEHVVHFARSLDECLPSAVRRDLAFVSS